MSFLLYFRLPQAYKPCGADVSNALGSENNKTIFKCEICNGTFKDSSGSFVPADGYPTIMIKIHEK